MEVPFPEHRIYTVLACFQAAFVMIGTFAIRVATNENLRESIPPAPWIALWLRNSGYLFLLVPVAGLAWAIWDISKDEGNLRSGWRMLIAFLLTAAVGLFFWAVWDRSIIQHHSMTETGSM